jgi:hypothetical protein
VSESEGERLARLEVLMEQLTHDVRAHLGDHRDAVKAATEAKETAKESAVMAAIAHRSNKTARLCAYIGGGFLVISQLLDMILALSGHPIK